MSNKSRMLEYMRSLGLLESQNDTQEPQLRGRTADYVILDDNLITTDRKKIMSYHYEYHDGHYVLMRDDSPVSPPMKEVAILYTDSKDLPGTVLHMHGSVENVLAQYDRMHSVYTAGGLAEEAMELKVFRSDQIPVDELNKCLEICDYVGRMVQQMDHTFDNPSSN